MSQYIRHGHDLSNKKVSPALAKSINERCNYVYNGQKYGLPIYYRKKIFYETGINQNLVSSPLAKVCNLTKRVYFIEDANREFRQLVSGKEVREAKKAISRLIEGEKNSLRSRFNVANASLQRSYKSSKF